MGKVYTLIKRELLSYFTTPIAYIFLIIFLLLNGVCTFYFGNFFSRGQADLLPFFNFHPWLYMIFIPAITMRLFSEERKTGTIEILLTLPISSTSVVLGKFIAAWIFSLSALLLTFPLWISVNYLGKPDNGVIFASYLGSSLMSGGFIAVGSCMSMLTKNQIVAFITSMLICLIVNLSGFPVILDYFYSYLPSNIVEITSSFSFVTNFNMLTKGILEIKSLVFFISFIAFWLVANVIVLDLKKAD